MSLLGALTVRMPTSPLLARVEYQTMFHAVWPVRNTPAPPLPRLRVLVRSVPMWLNITELPVVFGSEMNTPLIRLPEMTSLERLFDDAPLKIWTPVLLATAFVPRASTPMKSFRTKLAFKPGSRIITPVKSPEITLRLFGSLVPTWLAYDPFWIVTPTWMGAPSAGLTRANSPVASVP